jgi:hypothetical protein
MAAAHDPLDPGVAEELELLRDRMIERLSREVAQRNTLRRAATIEAVVGLVGALTVGGAFALRPMATAGSFALGTLALAACILSAFDMRRIRALDVQIHSLARAVAALVSEGP